MAGKEAIAHCHHQSCSLDARREAGPEIPDKSFPPLPPPQSPLEGPPPQRETQAGPQGVEMHPVSEDGEQAGRGREMRTGSLNTTWTAVPAPCSPGKRREQQRGGGRKGRWKKVRSHLAYLGISLHPPGWWQRSQQCLFQTTHPPVTWWATPLAHRGTGSDSPIAPAENAPPSHLSQKNNKQEKVQGETKTKGLNNGLLSGT